MTVCDTALNEVKPLGKSSPFLTQGLWETFYQEGKQCLTEMGSLGRRDGKGCVEALLECRAHLYIRDESSPSSHDSILPFNQGRNSW